MFCFCMLCLHSVIIRWPQKWDALQCFYKTLGDRADLHRERRRHTVQPAADFPWVRLRYIQKLLAEFQLLPQLSVLRPTRSCSSFNTGTKQNASLKYLKLQRVFPCVFWHIWFLGGMFNWRTFGIVGQNTEPSTVPNAVSWVCECVWMVEVNG